MQVNNLSASFGASLNSEWELWSLDVDCTPNHHTNVLPHRKRIPKYRPDGETEHAIKPADILFIVKSLCRTNLAKKLGLALCGGSPDGQKATEAAATSE